MVLDWNDLQWWCANTSNYPIQFMPSWWSTRHDRRLLWAIVKFGWHNWQEMLTQQIKPFDRPLPDASDDPAAVQNQEPLAVSQSTFTYLERRWEEQIGRGPCRERVGQ